MVCGTYFAGSDTVLVFKLFHGVFEGGTRLAMPKTICAPDSSSLKPGSGAGSLGLGGVRMAGL